jgi:hypothetical protein
LNKLPKDINTGNFNVVMTLFSVLVLISLSIVGFEVYRNLKKQSIPVIEGEHKDYEYMLLEDERDVELYEYKEVGIRDI